MMSLHFTPPLEPEVEIKLDKRSTVLGVSLLPVTEADALQEDRLYKGVPTLTGDPTSVLKGASRLRTPINTIDPEPRVLAFFVSDGNGRFFSLSPIYEIFIFSVVLGRIEDETYIQYDRTPDGRYTARHGIGIIQ